MILEVKNLTKTFSQGSKKIHALNDVSFSIKEKESLAIVGPSGSGKTTLLSLLAGLDSVSKGEVTIANEKVHLMNEKALTDFRARNIGIVFQQFHLMPHLTALENVSLPLDILGQSDADKKSKDILKLVGLSDRVNHRPHELSGGECQRVALARASVVKPKILLADEPSGNLDMETGKKVMDLLFNLANENAMTLVLITHDQNLAKRCQKQIHLVGGKLQ